MNYVYMRVAALFVDTSDIFYRDAFTRMSTSPEKSVLHEGWGDADHADFWKYLADDLGRYEFIDKMEKNIDRKLLLDAIGSLDCPTVLDFGCSTGWLLRYLRLKLNQEKYKYTGVDISGPAISYAKAKYGESFFQLIKVDSDFLSQNKFDIVFSSDTVLHQPNPYEFLGVLINVARKYLVIKLRTRDIGETELDTDKSCQMHYGKYWMPFLVLNSKELLDYLRKNRKVVSVKMIKSYRILGGERKRFLPKELYFEEAGGSATSLLIELGDDPRPFGAELSDENIKVIIENRHKSSRRSSKQIIRKIVSRVIAAAEKFKAK